MQRRPVRNQTNKAKDAWATSKATRMIPEAAREESLGDAVSKSYAFAQALMHVSSGPLQLLPDGVTGPSASTFYPR